MMASSPYFRSRRARPKALGQLNGINVCNPLQATEIMAEEGDGVFLLTKRIPHEYLLES